MTFSLKIWGYGALSISFIALLFFLDLGEFPIFQWDEARYVNNSVEVLTLGNWFNFTMDGAVDVWNFKPPLVLWLQAGSMKLFGVNEWAARLPSALAGVGIAVLLYWFCVTALRSVWTGVATVLFFGASCGFISPHIGRSADLDAVQTFFTIWYVLLFIRYLLSDKPNKHIFLWLGILVVLAFLCKGMPGLLLLPYLAIIALLHKNHKKVFFNRTVYVYAAAALAVMVAYYVLRDLHYPGYWELVKKSEFNRFSGKGVEWHKQPFGFYFTNFIELKRYFFLLYLLPFTLAVFFIATNPITKRALLYCWIIAAGYLLFISAPPVKLAWYDAPLYPCFALIFGISICTSMESLVKRPKWLPLSVIGSTIALCFPHYLYTWKQIHYSPDKTPDYERAGLAMRRLSESEPPVLDYTIFVDKRKIEHLDQMKFYQKAFAQRHQTTILLKDKVSEMVPGELVLTSQPRFSDSIRLYFPAAEMLYDRQDGQLFRLK